MINCSIKETKYLYQLDLTKWISYFRFFMRQEGEIILLEMNNFDDILMKETDEAIIELVNDFIFRFKLGEVVHGPGALRFYGINIIKNDDYYF